MPNISEHITDEEQRLLNELNDNLHKKQADVKQKDHTRMMKDIISQARSNGFRAPDYRVRWKLKNADELLARGLVKFLGEKAQWLPEYDEVAEWLADNKGQGLLCIGRCGRGKTLITREVLPWLFENHIRCNLNGDGRLLRPVYKYFKADRDLKEQFSYICRSRLLCIDDLGTEQIKYFGREENYFDRLVQGDRFERDQLLICSTNLTYEQMFGGEDPDTHIVYPQRYDDRTRSRLLACCRRVIFDGEDMRNIQ